MIRGRKWGGGQVKTMGGLDHSASIGNIHNRSIPQSSPDATNLPKPSWKRRKKGVNKEPSQWVSSTQISV